MVDSAVAGLKEKISSCQICLADLPHQPRPITSWNPESRIVIIGQAPGRAVHESGVLWQDASGRLLRSWLGVTEREFYDPCRFALIPMGFCFPGKGKSGDLAPRSECAPHWHGSILGILKQVQLTLLIGCYSQEYYLSEQSLGTLTQNVANFQKFLPKFFPLPHPSPRNRPWLSKNPWFEKDLIPELRRRVADAL